MSASARRITRNVVVLGLVSLCTDLSSEMLYPVIPLFVVGHLGASPALLGLIEGLADGISSGLRWVGGVWSDRTRRRKPFVVIGYSLSALSKPMMGAAAIAIGWPLFLVARALDRFGKSTRTAARDALIADSSAPEVRGLAFGFHRAMDTCGAIAGPLLAMAALIAWGSSSLPWLFLVAFIPGVASVGLALAGVREIRPPVAAAARRGPGQHESGEAPGAGGHSLAWLILAFAVFSVGNSSDALLLLRAGELGLTGPQVIAAYVLMNVVYAVGAAPLGHLADRLGPRTVLAWGWVVYAAVYFGFSVCQGTEIWMLLAAYGLYLALTEGVAKALVSRLVVRQRMAGAIGLMASIAGIGQFTGSLAAGVLWGVRIGDVVLLPFAIGCGCALLGVVILVLAPIARSVSAGHASRR